MMTGFPYTTRIAHARPILDRLPHGAAIVAEVGVLRGKLSAELLKNRPDITLHMIDWWEAHDPASEAYAESLATAEPCGVQTPEQVSDNYAEAQRIADMFGGRLVRAKSTVAADAFHDNHFDIVFLDADHSEQAVREDIAAWWPKVKPGGWLGGHDYETRGMPNGVKAAVDAAFPSVELDAFFTWFVRKEVADAD
jgi:hypothetical protein